MIMSNRSFEVRWFYKGEIPEITTQWFKGLGKTIAQPQRTDMYLSVKGSTKLGIKLREGRLEIKKQEGKILPFVINEHMQGKAGYWDKITFSLEQDPEIFQNGLASNDWFPVKKTRTLILFEITNGTCLQADIEGPWLQNGCFAELTQLSFQKASWWTIGFEAFGEPGRLPGNLATACNHVLPGNNQTMFSSNNSFSYPSWLSTFTPASDLKVF
jgi:hypothetical protein